MRRESNGVFDLKVSGATGICLKRTIYHNTSLSYFLFGKTKGTEKSHVEYEIQSGSGRQNWKPVELKAFIAGQISSTQQLVIFKWLKKPQPNHYFILRILKQYDLKLWNISIDDSGIWDSCHPPTMAPHPYELKMKKVSWSLLCQAHLALYQFYLRTPPCPKAVFCRGKAELHSTKFIYWLYS